MHTKHSLVATGILLTRIDVQYDSSTSSNKHPFVSNSNNLSMVYVIWILTKWVYFGSLSNITQKNLIPVVLLKYMTWNLFQYQSKSTLVLGVALLPPKASNAQPLPANMSSTVLYKSPYPFSYCSSNNVSLDPGTSW